MVKQVHLPSTLLVGGYLSFLDKKKQTLPLMPSTESLCIIEAKGKKCFQPPYFNPAVLTKISKASATISHKHYNFFSAYTVIL